MPFSGITKSGRVWRKVPESNARSVSVCVSGDDIFMIVTICYHYCKAIVVIASIHHLF